MTDGITRVGVIGAGQMGAGIAEVSARAGVDVLVFETTEALTTAGRDRITKSLDRGVSAGKITERERDAAVANLKFTTDLADFADRQLVIEAVIEDESIKSSIFAKLDEVITDPDAVLASNTSSIPIMKIAAATKNPGRVLGLHFFNPVPVLPLVELISTLVTTPRRPPAPRPSRARCWASRWCALPIVPASWSTSYWCPTCWPPSVWPNPVSPQSKTSTRRLSRACRTRWVRCGCRISSASTR